METLMNKSLEGLKSSQKNVTKIGTGPLIFFLFCLMLLILMAVTNPRVSIPFLVSYTFVLILAPFRPYFKRKKFRGKMYLAFILIALSAGLIYPLTKIILTLQNESKNLMNIIPDIEIHIRNYYEIFRQKILESTGLSLGQNFLNDFLEWSKKQSTLILSHLPNLLAHMFEWLLLVPLFVYFLFIEGDKYRKSFFKLVPNRYFERSYFVYSTFQKQLGGYIWSKFLEASLMGFMICIGLMIINIPFALLLAFVAAVTNVIPYIGPILGFIPAFIVALVHYGPHLEVVILIFIFLLANLIDMVIIFPVLVSKVVDLHPMIVIVSVIL
jgi:putative permease